MSSKKIAVSWACKKRRRRMSARDAAAVLPLPKIVKKKLIKLKYWFSKMSQKNLCIFYIRVYNFSTIWIHNILTLLTDFLQVLKLIYSQILFYHHSWNCSKVLHNVKDLTAFILGKSVFVSIQVFYPWNSRKVGSRFHFACILGRTLHKII